jgi:hypothetical protein
MQTAQLRSVSSGVITPEAETLMDKNLKINPPIICPQQAQQKKLAYSLSKLTQSILNDFEKNCLHNTIR